MELIPSPSVLALLLAALTATKGTPAAPAPTVEVPQPRALRVEIREGWRLRSSTLVREGGEVLSTSAFVPEGWYPTAVPTTVLSALVRSGVYPDPRIDLDAFLVPDSSDEFNAKHRLEGRSYLPDGRNPWKDPYWFRACFDLPVAEPGSRTWLNLDSINYRADVWLNGRRIASREEIAGMFRRFRLDVTAAALTGTNCLALLVHPVDHPGVPDTQLDVFGKDRGYHKEIMKDVTEVMTIGYDCMPTVPDRNLGVPQRVWIDRTGPVDLRHPFVVTDLPLPATDRATLGIRVDIHNAETRPIRGVLRGAVRGTDVRFSKDIDVGAGETREVRLLPAPVIEAPRLWWPVLCGDQYLYELELAFEAGGAISDREVVRFGVREVTTELHERDGAHGLRVLVNGRRVFCRGGYIQPEILLEWDRDRMEAEIRYFTSANLNLVYFEDIPNPPDDFLDLCDRHGLLFGNCFYGCYWMTPGSGFPEDLDLLERSTVDLVRRYRNHPSLILYMAMNEGDTREDIYEMWRRHILALDGTRFFIPSGTFPPGREDVPPWIRKDTPVGMTDVGASYTWQDPATYFRWVLERPAWMFMMESGSASLPPVQSLARFLRDVERASPERSAADGAPFPLTRAWAHHGANHYYRDYDAAVRRLHGEPATVADYCWRGHLVTADQHRSMFEAVRHRMWDITSGFTQWKINACWPSVQWQIFDWYLRPMVSHPHIRRACEPLHVQLNRHDHTVAVINDRPRATGTMQVHASVRDLEMRERWRKEAAVEVAGESWKDVFAVPVVEGIGPVWFVDLRLLDGDGAAVSDGFYWLPAEAGGGLQALDLLPSVRLEATSTCEGTGDRRILRATVRNPTGSLAFFVQLALARGKGGDEVLPVLWDDNFFSLLPGETRQVRAEFRARDAGSEAPVLEVGGWNVETDPEIGPLQIPGRTPRAGSPFTVRARVSRTFLAGSRVLLDVDGGPAGSRFAWARGPRSEEVTFEVRIDEPGAHRLKVGRSTTEITVER